MKTHKILFVVTLLCGIVILGIGIYLKLANQESSGYTSGRSGSISQGTITGNGALFLGILTLLFALGSLWMLKEEKKERAALATKIYPPIKPIKKKRRGKK